MTTTQPAAPATAVVARLLDAWADARAELAALERAEHPDLTDVHGRVWTWWKGDLYTTPRPDLYPPGPERPEGGRSAVPRCFIRTA